MAATCINHQLQIVDYEETWIVVACEKCKQAWSYDRRLEALEAQKETPSPDGQRITASPITGNRSDAVATESTPLTTPPSSPSDQNDMPNGLAEHASWCVGWWLTDVQDELEEQRRNPPTYSSPTWGALNWCNRCGALWSQGKILVPAARPMLSTSPRLETPQSAESQVAAGSRSFGYIPIEEQP